MAVVVGIWFANGAGPDNGAAAAVAPAPIDLEVDDRAPDEPEHGELIPDVGAAGEPVSIDDLFSDIDACAKDDADCRSNALAELSPKIDELEPPMVRYEARKRLLLSFDEIPSQSVPEWVTKSGD